MDEEIGADLIKIGKAIEKVAMSIPGPADDRFLFRIGGQLFNPRHIVRAEFKATRAMMGTVKIWFSSDAGLGGKPLIFKGKDGDFVWAFLGTIAEDSKTMLII